MYANFNVLWECAHIVQTAKVYKFYEMKTKRISPNNIWHYRSFLSIYNIVKKKLLNDTINSIIQLFSERISNLVNFCELSVLQQVNWKLRRKSSQVVRKLWWSMQVVNIYLSQQVFESSREHSHSCKSVEMLFITLYENTFSPKQ